MKKSVSVIIPTKNGGDLFRQSLDMIFSQEIDFSLEVLVVDSGSTDNTLEICSEYPVRLLEISPSMFDHASTRNLAISQAQSDLCVLTVQDAVPFNKNWLSTLVAPLNMNDRVAGSFGQQVSRDDAHALSKCCKLLWYKEWRNEWEEEHEQLPVDADKWEILTFEEKRRLARFDNVNSCIRKSVWQAIPFPEARYAEDMAWAQKVLTAGFSIFWEPEAKVFHSHDRSLAYEFQRSFVDVKSLTQLFANESLPLTYKMTRSVIEWLISEAGKYLQANGEKGVQGKESVGLIGRADRIWQVNVRKEQAEPMNGSSGSISSAPFVNLFRRSVLQQFYKNLSGPEWLRRLCRRFVYSGYGFRRKSNSLNDSFPVMRLQGQHRFFLNQLLQFYFDNTYGISGSIDSVRFGAAVMVAGSFLGQHLQLTGSSERVEKENQKERCHYGNTGSQDFWVAVGCWYQGEYAGEDVAISELDRLLSTGV